MPKAGPAADRGARSRAANLEIVDGEYIRPQSESHRSAEETIEKIAWLMDRSIPIGGIRIGLDPLLGLIPGIGDVVGALISTTLIVQAYRAGVPKSTVLRMMVNVGIDAILGAVPIAGDVFDWAFKANSRNLDLFRATIRGHHRRSSDWGFLAVVFAGIAAMVAIPVAFGIWLLSLIF